MLYLKVDLVENSDLQLESLLLNSIKLKDTMLYDDEENDFYNEDETDYYYFNVSEIYKSSDETSSSQSINLGMTDSFHSKKIVSIINLETNIQSVITEIEVRFFFYILLKNYLFFKISSIVGPIFKMKNEGYQKLKRLSNWFLNLRKS